MKVYYINENCTFKGPCDILCPDLSPMLRIGDICIRESAKGISILLIVSSTNKWSRCLCLYSCPQKTNRLGNSLVFSYDGLNKRYCNVVIIKQLLDILQNTKIRCLFQNLFDIANYKSDLIDFTPIANYLTINMDHNESNKDCSETAIKKEMRTNFLFEEYLSDDAATTFATLFNQGYTPKDAYKRTRELYPASFRCSLKKFLHEHPKSNIYDKSDK